MTLRLDAGRQVTWANRAARDFFSINPARLPASVIEVTLESRLFELVQAGEGEVDVTLVHHRRVVRAAFARGAPDGETFLFLSDVSDLKRLETVRREFIANLVHELKTPLTSLRLAAENLAGELPPKDRRRFAERVMSEADLISKIIDNLRQLGDIETNAIHVERSEFDVSELVEESLDRLGLDRPVNVSIEPGLRLTSDRPKVLQALNNVLDNAAKFSPAGTAIDITATRGERDVVLSVRDRGPGISPEHWSRVFERFYKVDRARPREAGGFGLGLAITKHLVQVLGGRIWTEAAPDGGQVFSIALPARVLTAR